MFFALIRLHFDDGLRAFWYSSSSPAAAAALLLVSTFSSSTTNWTVCRSFHSSLWSHSPCFSHFYLTNPTSIHCSLSSFPQVWWSSSVGAYFWHSAFVFIRLLLTSTASWSALLLLPLLRCSEYLHILILMHMLLLQNLSSSCLSIICNNIRSPPFFVDHLLAVFNMPSSAPFLSSFSAPPPLNLDKAGNENLNRSFITKTPFRNIFRCYSCSPCPVCLQLNSQHGADFDLTISSWSPWPCYRPVPPRALIWGSFIVCILTM